MNPTVTPETLLTTIGRLTMEKEWLAARLQEATNKLSALAEEHAKCVVDAKLPTTRGKKGK